MDSQPHGPGNKAREANFPYFQNGEGATYRGEISFVGITGQGKIRQYFNPAPAVYFGLQPLTGRRGFDTCAPDNGFRCYTRTCNHDAIVIDGFDGSPRSNLHP